MPAEHRPANTPEPEPTYVKQISRGCAPEDLTDALANLMHVHDGDLNKVRDEYVEAFDRALRHYRDECAHVDGCVVEIV